MSTVIVVVGEALVDLVVGPDGDLDAALGGAPFNVARAAARMGAPVVFAGRLSNDRFGRRLRDALDSDGVGVATEPTDAPTTLALAEIGDDGSASYRFYLDGTSAPLVGDSELTAALDGLGSADVVVTGGLALVLEPMASALERRLADASEGPSIVVDVNARPSVVGDRDAFRARVGRILDAADVVKVSDEDLAFLAPGSDPLTAARGVLDRGPSVVVLTEGASPTTALVRTRDGFEQATVELPPLPGDVVDTIGAGDTFLGAFVARLVEGGAADGAAVGLDVVVDAVRVGNAAAGVVVTRRGADPPRRTELPTDPG